MELKNYKLWILVEGREVEYGDYHRLEMVSAVEKRLREKGYDTFVEEITNGKPKK